MGGKGERKEGSDHHLIANQHHQSIRWRVLFDLNQPAVNIIERGAVGDIKENKQSIRLTDERGREIKMKKIVRIFKPVSWNHFVMILNQTWAIANLNWRVG
jgi:hypothetical protein